MKINFSEIDKYLKRFDYDFLDGEYASTLSAVKNFIKPFSKDSIHYDRFNEDYECDSIDISNADVDVYAIYEKCSINCCDDSLGYLDDLSKSYTELDNMLRDAYDSKRAIEYINNILAAKNLSNAYVSNQGDIDPALLSRILNNKQPLTKDTCIKLCIGIGLTFNESQDLLLRLGYTINSLHTRDRIIRFGIERGMDIFSIDDILCRYSEKGLMKNMKLVKP